jgi:hypothetical protein
MSDSFISPRVREIYADGWQGEYGSLDEETK